VIAGRPRRLVPGAFFQLIHVAKNWQNISRNNDPFSAAEEDAPTGAGHQTRYELRDEAGLSCVLTYHADPDEPATWKILLPGPGGAEDLYGDAGPLLDAWTGAPAT